MKEWWCLQQLVQNYEATSRQMLNKDKTIIFFSKNTRKETQQYLLSVIGVKVVHCYKKYLTLLVKVGRVKIRTFKYILNRVWQQISNWKLKSLSQASKEVLIKAVLQAIHTHSMSLFKLPKGLLQDITEMM